jgi:hypothetical protein
MTTKITGSEQKSRRQSGLLTYKFLDYYIVSVDLVGSSKLKDEYGVESIPAAYLIERHLVEALAKKCGGMLVTWAGDGGAVLFKHTQMEPIKPLRFAIGLYYLTWSNLFNFSFIYQNMQKANADDLGKNIDEILLQLNTKFLNIVCPNIRATTKTRTWLMDQLKDLVWDRRKEKESDRPSFRIVCHAGKVAVNNNNPSTSYGPALNNLLKYERELGLENAITITNAIQDYMKLVPFSGSEIHFKRHIGGITSTRIFPSDRVDELDFHSKSTPIAAILERNDEYSESPPPQGLQLVTECMVHVIREYFKRSPQENRKARVFNIGLGTFVTNLDELWKYLVENSVRLQVLLPDQFQTYMKKKAKRSEESVYRPCLESTNNILRAVLSEGKSRCEKNGKDLDLSFLNNQDLIELRYYPTDDIIRTRFPFGPRFGCSLYSAGESMVQEGTNFFLTQPFSIWESITLGDREYGYWDYSKVFYFGHECAKKHLNKLASQFDSLWNNYGSKEKWPID